MKSSLLALSDPVLLFTSCYSSNCFTDHADHLNSCISYQFNPHLTKDETITNILVKALTVFPSPDFSLCLHLLPPHILHSASSASSLPAAGDAPLSEAVQKLTALNTLLSQADYKGFWNTLDSDDLYADLVADVSGFEEIMRVRIAVTVGQSCRELEVGVLESWLQLHGQDFERFVVGVCEWGIDNTTGGRGGIVSIPVNKENEAKGTIVRENVNFERKSINFHARNKSANRGRICTCGKASLRTTCITVYGRKM